MDSVAGRSVSLRGILELVLYISGSLQFFKSCMVTVNFNGCMAALVSHQGKAITATWNSMTYVTLIV
jgi:hypothetical protein